MIVTRLGKNYILSASGSSFTDKVHVVGVSRIKTTNVVPSIVLAVITVYSISDYNAVLNCAVVLVVGPGIASRGAICKKLLAPEEEICVTPIVPAVDSLQKYPNYIL